MGLPMTIGTAGHVDHGKTALVKALTGTDTDRLPEEKRRGLTIELGFAELELPGGKRVSLIDAPGHERFVRTMVAGASGIGMYLMVVAADDGIMPQTREHWLILQALGIEHGVVAVTKQEVVDEARLLGVVDDIRLMMGEVPIVSVSALQHTGLPDLLAAIEAAAERAAAQGGQRQDHWYESGPVLHVDRVFTLKGVGVVVTGTLAFGSIAKGTEIKILPSERAGRIRTIQVHGIEQDRTGVGRRVALDLAGIKHTDIARGDVIVGLDSSLRPTYRLDVELTAGTDEQLMSQRRVQVHHGTRNSSARFVVLDPRRRYAQLRLDNPLLAMAGDRLVIRGVAPPETLGGGIVIDPHPRRHGPGPASDQLDLIASGAPPKLVERALVAQNGTTVHVDPERWIDSPILGPALHRFQAYEWRHAVDQLLKARKIVRLSPDRLGSPATASHQVRDRSKICPGPSPEALRVLQLLQADDLTPRSPAAIAMTLNVSNVNALLDELIASRHVIRLSDKVYYPDAALAEAASRVLSFLTDQRKATIAELRDELGITRKYVQALLEHLARAGKTRRHGDHHVRREQATGRILPSGRQESGGSTGLQSQ